MGTPQFAASALESIIQAGYIVPAVFTQPDKKAGRKQIVKKSAVKELAEKNEIPVFDQENIKTISAAEEIAKMRPDLIVVFAYGKILPKNILEIPKYGSINLHASLLPKFRGASPVQEAILSGEKKTGITLMLMNEKMDAGEIINQEELAIEKNDDTPALTKKLTALGVKMLIDTLPLWVEGLIKATPQKEDEATYCRIIKKEDGEIDWSGTAEIIFRKYRAYQLWPGIHTFYGKRKKSIRLKLENISFLPKMNVSKNAGEVIKYNQDIAVQTGNGLIILKTVQLEGKKATSAKDYARGNPEFLASILGKK